MVSSDICQKCIYCQNPESRRDRGHGREDTGGRKGNELAHLDLTASCGSLE